jgi:hypothetical protein
MASLLLVVISYSAPAAYHPDTQATSKRAQRLVWWLLSLHRVEKRCTGCGVSALALFVYLEIQVSA